MNKGMYKENQYIYWYKTWKNSLENSGTTITIEDCTGDCETWIWENWWVDFREGRDLIGAACLAQW